MPLYNSMTPDMFGMLAQEFGKVRERRLSAPEIRNDDQQTPASPERSTQSTGLAASVVSSPDSDDGPPPQYTFEFPASLMSRCPSTWQGQHCSGLKAESKDQDQGANSHSIKFLQDEEEESIGSDPPEEYLKSPCDSSRGSDQELAVEESSAFKSPLASAVSPLVTPPTTYLSPDNVVKLPTQNAAVPVINLESRFDDTCGASGAFCPVGAETETTPHEKLVAKPVLSTSERPKAASVPAFQADGQRKSTVVLYSNPPHRTKHPDPVTPISFDLLSEQAAAAPFSLYCQPSVDLVCLDTSVSQHNADGKVQAGTGKMRAASSDSKCKPAGGKVPLQKPSSSYRGKQSLSREHSTGLAFPAVAAVTPSSSTSMSKRSVMPSPSEAQLPTSSGSSDQQYSTSCTNSPPVEELRCEDSPESVALGQVTGKTRTKSFGSPLEEGAEASEGTTSPGDYGVHFEAIQLAGMGHGAHVLSDTLTTPVGDIAAEHSQWGTEHDSDLEGDDDDDGTASDLMQGVEYVACGTATPGQLHAPQNFHEASARNQELIQQVLGRVSALLPDVDLRLSGTSKESDSTLNVDKQAPDENNETLPADPNTKLQQYASPKSPKTMSAQRTRSLTRITYDDEITDQLAAPPGVQDNSAVPGVNLSSDLRTVHEPIGSFKRNVLPRFQLLASISVMLLVWFATISRYYPPEPNNISALLHLPDLFICDASHQPVTLAAVPTFAAMCMKPVLFSLHTQPLLYNDNMELPTFMAVVDQPAVTIQKLQNDLCAPWPQDMHICFFEEGQAKPTWKPTRSCLPRLLDRQTCECDCEAVELQLHEAVSVLQNDSGLPVPVVTDSNEPSDPTICAGEPHPLSEEYVAPLFNTEFTASQPVSNAASQHPYVFLAAGHEAPVPVKSPVIIGAQHAQFIPVLCGTAAIILIGCLLKELLASPETRSDEAEEDESVPSFAAATVCCDVPESYEEQCDEVPCQSPDAEVVPCLTPVQASPVQLAQETPIPLLLASPALAAAEGVVEGTPVAASATPDAATPVPATTTPGAAGAVATTPVAASATPGAAGAVPTSTKSRVLRLKSGSRGDPPTPNAGIETPGKYIWLRNRVVLLRDDNGDELDQVDSPKKWN